MAFDWGEDPLGSREIVSVHRAVTLFNAAAAAPGGNGMTRSLAQMKLLSDAHCLGFSYVSGTDAETRYHRREVIEALARQPVRTREDVIALGRAGGLPGDAVLVLRQRERQEIPEEQWRTYGPDGEVRYERRWFGYDRRMARSEDPAERAEQEIATRELWPVAPVNVRRVERVEQSGGALPLIVSVGGLVVGCREIIGFDRERERWGSSEGRRSFRVRPAGSWADPLVDTWLESGAGKAALWWPFT